MTDGASSGDRFRPAATEIQFSGGDPTELLRRLRDLAEAVQQGIGGVGPTPLALSSAPLLYDWYQAADVCPVVGGRIACGPGGRNSEFVTREVMMFSPGGGWVRTLAGLYRLGSLSPDDRPASRRERGH